VTEPEAEVQDIQIKVMMAADAAQAVGGKLYILGGGFDRVHAPTLPFQYKFDLAMIISVPWTATNTPYQIVVELLDADGTSVGYRAEAMMETGRPPGIRQGTSFTVPVAIPVVAEFREPGRYALTGAVNGKESNRVVVEVASTAAASGTAPPEPS
jgi:hypothetical protein